MRRIRAHPFAILNDRTPQSASVGHWATPLSAFGTTEAGFAPSVMQKIHMLTEY